MSWGNNDKGFSFTLSAWVIVVSVTGYVSGVSLILKCLSGRKWLLYTVALVALTLGYDRNHALTHISCLYEKKPMYLQSKKANKTKQIYAAL